MNSMFFMMEMVGNGDDAKCDGDACFPLGTGGESPWVTVMKVVGLPCPF
jgi:hypothetical protein